jgi:5'(3')-deoxyribonucleotidase
MKMKVSVDVDGVLFDIMEPFCEMFNKRYNTRFKKTDVCQWDFFLDWNVKKQDVFDLFFEIYNDPSPVPLIDENAPEILEKLNKRHIIDIVSARTKNYTTQLKKELAMHGIEQSIHYKQLILVHNSPKDIKITLDYDLYIDDNPHLAESIKKEEELILLLYSQPWNDDITLSSNIKRVKSWKEIDNYFNEIL